VCPFSRTPAALAEIRARQPTAEDVDLPPLRSVIAEPGPAAEDPTPEVVEPAGLQGPENRREEEAFLGLPNSIQRSPSLIHFSTDDGLNDLVAKLEASWGSSNVEGQLKRLPSMSNYIDIDEFFNAAGFDEVLDGVGSGLSPHEAMFAPLPTVGVC